MSMSTPIVIAQNTADAADPWAATTSSADTAAPWASGADAAQAAQAPAAAPVTDDPWVAVGNVSGSTDWLNGPDAVANAAPSADPTAVAQAAQQAHDSGFHLHELWDGSLPVQDWINSGLTWVVAHAD